MLSVLRKIRPKSLRAKLVFWYSVVFIGPALVLLLLIYARATRYLQTEANSFLKDEAAEFGRQVEARMPDVTNLQQYLKLEIGERRHFAPFYRILDAASGKILLVMPQPPVDVPVAAEAVRKAREGGHSVETVRARGETAKTYQVRTIAVTVDGRTYVLQYGILLKRLHGPLDRLKLYLALCIAGTVFTAIAGGWLLASRSLQPMTDTARTLREIRSTALDRRLPERAVKDEMGSLTEAINSMLDELEQAFYHTQAFTADVAHELRTPLATLRCEVEVAVSRDRPADEYRAALASALEQIKDLSKSIEHLLFLAKADSSTSLPDRTRVDLAATLNEVAEPFGMLAEAKGVGLSIDVAPDLVVEGKPEWLGTLFGNLLDNAVKYTPAGGSISMRARREDDCVAVRIEDTGAGMSDEEQGRIFDRFYRAAKSHSRETGGVGIGLSIVRRIVDLHGGRINVQSKLGQGSTFEVMLPAAS